MLSLKKQILYFLLIFITTSTQAATFQAGAGDPATASASANNSQPSPSPNYSTPTDPEFYNKYKAAEAGLNSAKSFEVRQAVNFFDRNLDTLIQNGKLKPEHVQILLSFFASDSLNIRNSTQSFFKKHRAQLSLNRLLDQNQISDLSKNVYNQKKDLTIFLGLMSAILPQIIESSIFDSEYSYILLEGLNTDEPVTSQYSTDVLNENMTKLMERSLWTSSHIKKFFLMIKDLPKNNYAKYLDILKQNFNSWVEKGFVAKEDVILLLQTLNQSKININDDFINFLTNKQTMTNLQTLGLFDKNWAVEIIANIKGDDSNKKQLGLTLFSFFLQVFSASDAVMAADFQDVWNYIMNNMETFDEPFLLLIFNHEFLNHSGWLKQKNYAELAASFETANLGTQKEILSFFDDQYDWLISGNWLSLTQLSKIMLPKETDDAQLKILKLAFLESHSDLVRSNLFDSKQLKLFLENLKSKDSEIFQKAVNIVDDNLNQWLSQKTFDRSALDTILASLDPNRAKTAEIISVLDHHLPDLISLCDKGVIVFLSTLDNDTSPKVSDAIETLFDNHKDMLTKLKLYNTKVKKHLKNPRNIY